MSTDIFAKIGDIKGESADAKHKDEIEVMSFSWGVANPDSFSGGGAGGVGDGKAFFNDLTIVHHIDKATPALLRACATGAHLKEATITHRKAGKDAAEYLVIKLNDVTIKAVIHSGSTADNSETVTLDFSKVDFEYRPRKQDGSLDAWIAFKYDIKGQRVL